MRFLFGVFLLCQWPVDVQSNTPQPNVLSDGKKSALYVWIHLRDGVDVGMVMRKMAQLNKYVEELCLSCRRDDYDDEVLAGVGFGTDFYSQAVPNNRQQQFPFKERKGLLGELPFTGGDIFIHAKSNSYSKLFELSQAIQKSLPPESFAEYKDVYGFVYKNGRDLSGFIDGTENPSRPSRFGIAIDPATNGSYCLTQEWVHHMGFISTQTVPTLESFVGRKLADSAELQNKSISSHVARMTSGPEFKARKMVEIYRQSMPYGTVGGDAGLFFIAFASSTNNFDVMLSRMTGVSEETSDDIMRLTRCVSGNYWYFPSVEELERLQNSVPGAGAAFRSSRSKLGTSLAALKQNDASNSSASTHRLESISRFLICFILVFVFDCGL